MNRSTSKSFFQKLLELGRKSNKDKTFFQLPSCCKKAAEFGLKICPTCKGKIYKKHIDCVNNRKHFQED